MLLLSALGVLLLTGMAWLLGFRDDPPLTAARAAEEAGRIPGFRPAGVLLAADGRSALVEAEDGALAVVLPLGDRLVSRPLPRGALPEGDTFDLGEPFLRRVPLPARAPGSRP